MVLITIDGLRWQEMGVPAAGVRRNITVTASQIAATVAAIVGEDFRTAAPNAAAPLPLR